MRDRAEPRGRRSQLFAFSKRRDLGGQQQTKRRHDRKDAIDPLGRNEGHHQQTSEAPGDEPECFRRHRAQPIANFQPLLSRPEQRQQNQQNAPGRESMQQMRQIKINRLRSMHRLAESSGEFPHDDMLQKFRHEKNSAHGPSQKDRERRQPRPPSGPRGHRFACSLAFATESDDSREQERVDNRALDQHGRAEQEKHPEAISGRSRLRVFEFFPRSASRSRTGSTRAACPCARAKPGAA